MQFFIESNFHFNVDDVVLPDKLTEKVLIYANIILDLLKRYRVIDGTYMKQVSDLQHEFVLKFTHILIEYTFTCIHARIFAFA